MSELPPYKDIFPEIPIITTEERRGKHFFFEDPKNQEEHIIAFLTNNINKEAIVQSWSESTKYPENSKFGPAVAYEHIPGQPNGQCGVTAMALAMAMVWNGIAPPEKIFYEEGKLLNANNTVIGDHHVWLRVEGDYGKEWRIDVASYQYADKFTHPDEMIGTVVQGVNHWVGHYTDINWRYIPPYATPGTIKHIPVPNALSLRYEVDEADGKKASTPISEYDASLFEGRLERFIYKYTQHIPRAIGNIALQIKENLWYPPNYNHSQETWNPREDINIVYKEERIQEILKSCNPATLATWAHDCAAHVLSLHEDSYPTTYLQQALDLLENSLQTNTIDEGEINRASVDCYLFARANKLKPATVHVAGSTISALQTLLNRYNYIQYATDAARNALWAAFHSDPSTSKMAVARELEWQHRHLTQLVKNSRK
jgi:hypothetical protein